MANPSPSINGKSVRHIIGTSTGLASFRTNLQTQYTINSLRALLTTAPGDCPSTSMLVRRALSLYQDYVLKCRDNFSLEQEQATVRQGTRMPNYHPKARRTLRKADRLQRGLDRLRKKMRDQGISTPDQFS